MRKATRVLMCLGIFCLFTMLSCEEVKQAAGADTIKIVLPDYGKDLRVFNAPIKEPVHWTQFVVNAGWGGGGGGRERMGGWIDRHFPLIDYVDRSADYTSHAWLKHHGIWHEVYGSNEYQETIHFHEEGAKKLFWNNGIARDMNGERVLSSHYNTSVEWWKKKIGWDAFIVCNNAPRWWSVINYDLLTSPLFGDSMSQDNIGGPTSRIGKGAHGRYCDYCNRKFFHYLETTNRLPEFRKSYKHIRDYVQANLMDQFRKLPPSDIKERFSPAEAERLAKLCDDPVMAEYMKFLYLSHIHNLMRYYQDQKVIAKRLGKQYSVHGNQGGGFMGPNAYQIALSDFVDTVWFESAGESAYDMFKYHWNNCWGAFRFEIGRAMLRGRKPLMCMAKFHKKERDLVEHEIAEPCAGGGVLFVKQNTFEKEPELQKLLQSYFELRHRHRALFANHGKRRLCQVALVHSIPTFMYRNYQTAVAAPPMNALSGMARAMEEGHIPFDVAILNHPEIHDDYASLDDLKRHRLIILPEVECLSDAQTEKIGKALDAGVTVGLVGNVGVRDENYKPRETDVVAAWKKRGTVVDLTPDPNFTPSRTKENDQTRATTASAISLLRKALGNTPLIQGDLPCLLWVKPWVHDCGVVSLHFVNYDIDFETGKAAPTKPVKLSVRLPKDIRAEEMQFLAPGQEAKSLKFERTGNSVTFELPSIRVYGVVLVGKKGLDAIESAIALGDTLMQRAKYAGVQESVTARRPKKTDDLAAAKAYAKSAEKLLTDVAASQEAKLVDEVQAMADIKDATLALDFGSKAPTGGWKAVRADTAYDEKTGFGWVPCEDASEPSPEELYYAMAHKHGKDAPREITEGYAIFWPYKTPIPEPINRGLFCGTPKRFRVKLDNGKYKVRVVTLNPSWTLRNFLVSGMVTANGAPVLLDAPHFKGAVHSRGFAIEITDGKLDLTFGGPTGWGVSALVIKPAQGVKTDSLAEGSIREWKVSPRYANSDWYPIFEVRAAPERDPAKPNTNGWTTKHAAPKGIGLVDLGTNTKTNVGDVVYATATIASDKARTVRLSIGASSAAQVWLNGEQIAYLPNQKGVLRDEFIGEVRLKPGRNVLLVKLCRYWERHWLFYASVLD
ncbi:MAG: hypothetical protein GXP25_07610 [Planctomycetes bacterium]|nr:hypothetical protein [Planctomycetota bacterium]